MKLSPDESTVLLALAGNRNQHGCAPSSKVRRAILGDDNRPTYWTAQYVGAVLRNLRRYRLVLAWQPARMLKSGREKVLSGAKVYELTDDGTKEATERGWTP
jgi:hypothetical protein